MMFKSMAHVRLLRSTLHWLRVPEHVHYKSAVITFKVPHDRTPRYLGPLVAVADLPGRRALLSASTSRLVIPPIKLSIVLAAVPFRLLQCSSSLERSARGRHLIVITADFPASIKNSSFQLLYPQLIL